MKNALKWIAVLGGAFAVGAGIGLVPTKIANAQVLDTCMCAGQPVTAQSLTASNCVSVTPGSGGNIDYTVPSNDYFCFDTAATCGGTPATHACLRFNSGTSYIEFGPAGNGIAFVGTAQGITFPNASTGNIGSGSAPVNQVVQNQSSAVTGCFATTTTNATTCTSAIELLGASNTITSSSASTLTIGAANAQNLNLTTSGGGKVQANGVAISSEWFDGAFEPLTTLVTGDFKVSGPTTNAVTLKSCNYTNQTAGGGTGTMTVKVSSAANGGGTVFATFSIAGNAAANTNTTCTINTAAVPAATTLHYAITADATTANVAGNVTLNGTTP